MGYYLETTSNDSSAPIFIANSDKKMIKIIKIFTIAPNVFCLGNSHGYLSKADRALAGLLIILRRQSQTSFWWRLCILLLLFEGQTILLMNFEKQNISRSSELKQLPQFKFYG